MVRIYLDAVFIQLPFHLPDYVGLHAVTKLWISLNDIAAALGDLGIQRCILVSEELEHLYRTHVSTLRMPNQQAGFICASCSLTILPYYPSPNQELIDKAVRQELNARELNRQRYGIKRFPKKTRV